MYNRFDYDKKKMGRYIKMKIDTSLNNIGCLKLLLYLEHCVVNRIFLGAIFIKIKKDHNKRTTNAHQCKQI